jgi:peptidoglycan/LPS O-acetylase OafA/YrhL
MDTPAVVAAPAARARRIEEIDFVKGALVLIMVLYHWINYFIGLQWGGYRYLRFLTPSFIFVTGYLIGHVYLQRYSYDDRRLHARLLWRGFKLLLLFVVLNLAAEYTVGGRLQLRGAPLSWVVQRAEDVFLKGSFLAAFDILVSIAYFLLLTPVILGISKILKLPLWLIGLVAVIVMAAADFRGTSNTILEMLSVAFLGLAAGGSQLALPQRTAVGLVTVLIAYAVYVGATTLWNAPFALQVVGVVLTLLLIYALALYAGTHGLWQRVVVRLGEYSLLSYIVQIAVLQLFVRSLRATPLHGPGLLIPFAATVVAMICVVELCTFARNRSVVVNRAYRLIFA